MASVRRILLAIFIAWPAASAQATEFSNVFGSEEVERASRSASVEALSALQGLFEALKLRELSDASAREAFVAAAQRLRQAAGQMRGVLEIYVGTELDRPLVAQDFQVLNTLYGGPLEAKSVGELYSRFASETDALAEQIEALSSSERPIYPQISGRLSRYMALAGTITEISARPRD